MGKELENNETQEAQESQVQESQSEESSDDTADNEQISQISEMMSAFGNSAETETEESEESKESAEAETEESEENTEEKKDPQNAKISELEAKIEELTKQLQTKAGDDTDNKEKETQTDDTYFKEKLDEVQKDLVSEYVGEDEYEAVFEKREKLNEVLKRVQNNTLQGVFRSIPKIIASIIPQHVMLYSKTMEFYKANPDLLEHKEKVGKIIDETSAKNPGWDLDKVLTFVAGKVDDPEDIGEVRRVLGLKKKAEKKVEQNNIKRPSFAKPSHVRKPGNETKLTGVEKEIDEMMKANS